MSPLLWLWSFFRHTPTSVSDLATSVSGPLRTSRVFDTPPPITHPVLPRRESRKSLLFRNSCSNRRPGVLVLLFKVNNTAGQAPQNKVVGVL